MNCAWQALLAIFPTWIRRELEKTGGETLREVRLRLGQGAEFVYENECRWTKQHVSGEDLNFCINSASKYSPWASQSISSGFLTAPGGHRIGICGDAVVKEGRVTGIRSVRSLCVRVARDLSGVASDAARITGSILIIGPPGSGKTTLLRDLIRIVSEREFVSVVDERGELFSEYCQQGKRVDILKGCSKEQGIGMVLRSMGPNTIAVDEITEEEDCRALLNALWCGVRLIATAHAGSVKDLCSRPLYRPLVESRIFDHILVMGHDKRWHEERLVGV